MVKGSIVAIVTPFKNNESVDYDVYESLVKWHAEQGTHGIVVAGTTGEAPALCVSEIERLVEITLAAKSPSMSVLVGNGGIATNKVIKASRALQHYEIDGFLTTTPYYVKPTQEGMQYHFNAIADALNKPIFLYNVPGRTGVDLSNESILRLSEHQNIIGIKEASGDLSRVTELVRETDGQFILLSGDDPTAFEFCLLGGHGVISVTSNLCPMLMATRANEIDSGNKDIARKIERTLALLHQELFIEANPIPVKWGLHQLGMIDNVLRLPLTPLKKDSSNLRKLIDQLQKSID